MKGLDMHAHTNGRLNTTRLTPTLPVAPVTRAIRAALAISATLLALGGSGTAIAQSCAFTASPLATETCEGVFTNTLPAPSFFTPVADLTLVLGDSANNVPTSVTPASSLMGIDAQWSGSVGMTSYADITTVGATGIFAYSATTATVNNQGSITTNVTAPGAKAMDVNAYGDVNVVNNGPINAYSTGVYDVTAVNANSVNGDVSVDNQALGAITASAQDGNAIAVNAYALGAATVTNEGTITASAVYGVAVGIAAQAVNGNASVTNSGDITVTSIYQQAIGISASSANGYASVTNSGSITATGGSGVEQTIGIEAAAELGSTAVNNGYITATSSYGAAVGVEALTTNGDAFVTNNGTITTTTNSVYQTAVGAVASSVNGQATVNNTGHISAINHDGLGVGIEAYSPLGSTINNSGYVVAGSYLGNTIGALAKAYNGDASITSSASGYIRAIALHGVNGYATGVFANATNGSASVTNAGTIFAGSNYGAATGIQVLASGANGGGDVYVGNSGKVEAAGSYVSDVRGIQAFSTTGTATVVNSGSVESASSQHEGNVLTTVDGIRAYGYGGATVTNSGRVYASGPWFANGITGIAYNGDASVTNTASGTIEVLGLVPTGINAVSTYGSAVANNVGSIVVFQDEKCFCDPGAIIIGTGIFADSEQGTGAAVTVTNSGSISINSLYGAYGVSAVAKNGNVSVGSSGSIAIVTDGYGSNSWGINAISDYGSVSIVNSGDISIVEGPVQNNFQPSDEVTGIFGLTIGKINNASSLSDLSIVNTGNISLTAFSGYGILGRSFQGSVSISNAGHITVDNSWFGEGIVGESYMGGSVAGDVTVDNSGSVSITGPLSATGLVTLVNSTGATNITNSGDITDASQLATFGVFARDENFANGGDVTIHNSGSISSITSVDNPAPVDHAGYASHSMGIHVYTYGGDITVGNTGSILAQTTANTQLPGSAIGEFVKNGYGNYFGKVGITNSGSITASLTSSNSLPAVGFQLPFYGPIGAATGILVNNTYGDVTVTNSGSISATSQSDHYAGGGVGNGVTAANGISVVSTLGNGVARSLNLGNITVTNNANGSITALASSSYGNGDTAKASGISAVVSVGSYGASLVSAGQGITINNAGGVSATALIANDATGVATATGISSINGSAAGFVNVINSNTITATATTTGAATATGIFASGNNVTAALNAGGSINATATGGSGAATGLSLTGSAPVTASNDGVLMATFIGAGKAYGATITSASDVTFSNSGLILASNATSAVGVTFNSPTNVTLTNSGTIAANSAAAGSVAVLSTGASNAVLNNSGTITGAIQTGAGNDSLSNAVGGVWNAIGASDFGAGDDTVTNAGTIHLNNTTISLGSDPAGNQFGNAGLITVVGSNTIAMGTGPTANPSPFTNNGTINFQNGTANNTLTIAGNFAGNGQVDLDVNGANGTGDLLKINGNVVAGSVNTVNVNLLTDPATASTTIPLVQVSGTSAAGSFVLGTFTQPKGFLGLSESLVSTPPNTTSLGLAVAATTPPPTGVGVGVTVTGLSELGTLAASAAPGVQSLMNSQIGTLEDRMGAVSQTIKGGLSLWTRAFADSGTVDPDHSAGNFGQNGNFGFDQSNSGEEVGLDFAISDEFKAGALFSKSRANQSLDGNQADSSQITGNTSGIYGTWIASSGLYVDASYRWMSFNDRLHAPNGYASIHGNADAFNLEVGKTWTLSNGLQIAPQFQYTLTKVDNINAQTGNLAGFQSTGDDASRARLGVMFSKAYTPASSNAVWMPYASLSVVQELDGKNSYAVNNTFFGETDTRGTSALAETGLNVQFGKLAVFGGLNWQDGGALKSFFGGQVGLRYTF